MDDGGGGVTVSIAFKLGNTGFDALECNNLDSPSIFAYRLGTCHLRPLIHGRTVSEGQRLGGKLQNPMALM